ncbi:MAG: DUF4432 family protein [Pirellulales bacterium]|nr:DUF4432 family protein [Pirellulales bacterium]
MDHSVWELPASQIRAGEVNFSLTAKDVPGTPSSWSIVGRVLTAGVSAGVEVIEINNGATTLIVIPTRGMGLWRAEREGETLGWKAPVQGPVHPQFVSLMEPSGVGWLDGFDELMVRCGLESNGSAVFDGQGRLLFPLHGRIANKPAHSLQASIDATKGTINLRGVVDESRLQSQKLRLMTTLTTAFGSSSWKWHDEVTNLGGSTATMQMLYHINVGEPILAPGARLVAPVTSVSPHDDYPVDAELRDYRAYPGVEANSIPQSFFFELRADHAGATEVVLIQPAGERGLAVRFNKQHLPWLTVWRSNASPGDGYVTSIEPGTNFPNPRPFEERQGRVVRLDPASSWSAEVEMDWLTDAPAVAAAELRVAALQGSMLPDIQDHPVVGWSAKARAERPD